MTLVALTMVCALAAVGLAGCGGTQRSASAFCGELKAGNARMKAHYDAAAKSGDRSGLGMLGVAVTNVGEFTRLLNRLEERAPTEIDGDMKVVQQAWQKEADAAGQAAGNPLGALGAGLMASFMSSASITTVDTYAANHCGMQIFGSATGLSGDLASSFGGATTGGTAGGTGTGSGTGTSGSAAGWSCDAADGVSTDAPFTELTTELDQMKASTLDGVPDAASALLDALDTLDPPPTTVAEAYGRLSFTNADARELIGGVSAAVATACSTDSGSGDDPLADITPRADGSSVYLGDVYGASCEPLGYTPAPAAVFTCESGTVTTVDLTTGVATSATGFPSSNDGEDGDSAISSLSLAGDEIAWVETTVTPAQGLSRPRWTATLHLRRLDGSTVADTTLAKNETTDSPGADLIAGTDDNGVYLLLGPHGDPRRPNLVHYDLSGRQAWSMKMPKDVDTNVDFPTQHTVLLNKQTLVDVTTGRTLIHLRYPTDGSLGDGCGTHVLVAGEGGFFSDTSGNGAWVTDTGDGVRMTPLTASFVDNRSGDIGAVTSVGMLTAQDVGIVDYAPPGKHVWTIGSDVLEDSTNTEYAALGRWVAVHNASGKPVVVDAATGKQADPGDADVTALLSDLIGADQSEGPQVAITDGSGTAWVDFGDGHLVHVARSDLCG